MADAFYVLLEGRGLIRVAGPDRAGFLQGLVSNDVAKVSPARAVYAAFLTPQGKYLYDFFLLEQDSAIYLDCEAARAAEFLRRLQMYKLRAKVVLDRPEGLVVAVAFGGGALPALGLGAEPGTATPFGGGIACVDPRLAAAGARLLLPGETAVETLQRAGLAAAPGASYDRLRLGLGIPDGSRDLAIDKTVLLEAGFDELNGVDWQKGCYIGQELTARTKYRGLVKKRLMPVRFAGAPPPAGTKVTTADGGDAGEMRSGQDGIGLALLRLDAVAEGGPLLAGETRIEPHRPDWARF